MKKLLIGLIVLGSISSFAYECDSTVNGKKINLAPKAVITRTFIRDQQLSNKDNISYFGNFSNYDENQSLSLEIALVKDRRWVGSEILYIVGVESKEVTIEDYNIVINCH